MTEDDEAKQRAHEVASGQQSCLSSSPLSPQAHESFRKQAENRTTVSSNNNREPSPPVDDDEKRKQQQQQQQRRRQDEDDEKNANEAAEMVAEPEKQNLAETKGRLGADEQDKQSEETKNSPKPTKAKRSGEAADRRQSIAVQPKKSEDASARLQREDVTTNPEREDDNHNQQQQQLCQKPKLPAGEHQQQSSSRSQHRVQNHGSTANTRRHNSNNSHPQQPQQPQGHLSTISQDSSQSSSAAGGQPRQQSPAISADYLAQLIKDKKQLAAFPSSVFTHLPRLVDEEIQRVRQQLFQLNDVVNLSQQQLELPEPVGEFVALQEKIYVPIGEHPEYNFVGRLLGPRGMTAKQLEQETGCKIMIRGKGSMRDKKKEEQNRGKANWEHLNDELHVLITVEDTQNRAKLKLQRAIEEVRQLLVPVVDGEDELKKRQLMELAIINGTYRDCNYNEALNSMLNDTAYRQSQLAQEHNASPTSGHHHQHHHQQHHHAHHMMNSGQHQGQLLAPAGGSPPATTPRHFLGGGHLLHQPYPNSSSVSLNGSTVTSSGVPSAGSNTPNSIQHGTNQHAPTQHRPHYGHPPPAPLPHLHQHHHQPSGGPHHLSHTAAAAVAAAAIAAAQQHHQQSGVQSGHPPQNPHMHLHHHAPASGGSPAAAAAAAAAAALMSSANPATAADANALIYAQQYHDFQHYAAMAAAAAASQQSILPLPEYNPHQPHPHPHAHHPHHPPPHHHHAALAQAVAAAAAAAAANQQIQHQYQRQLAEQQHHQSAEQANHESMVRYQSEQAHQLQMTNQMESESSESNGNTNYQIVEEEVPVVESNLVMSVESSENN